MMKQIVALFVSVRLLDLTPLDDLHHQIDCGVVIMQLRYQETPWSMVAPIVEFIVNVIVSFLSCSSLGASLLKSFVDLCCERLIRLRQTHVTATLVLVCYEP